MKHYFDVEVAKEYGIEKALLLEHICFWVNKNATDGKNSHDGKTWMFNSHVALLEKFPYLSKAKIGRHLKDLERSGAIITGNFNKKKYDRTKWYTVPESLMLQICNMQDSNLKHASSESETCKFQKCNMQDSNLKHASFRNDPPIPDIEKDKEEDKEQNIEKDDWRDRVIEVLDYLNQKTDSNFTKMDWSATQDMGVLFTNGYTVGDMISVIDSKCEDWLYNPSFRNSLKPRTLFALDKFENYLGEAKRKKRSGASINEQEVIIAWNSLGQTQHHGITAKAMQEMQNTYTVYKNRMIENGKEFRTIGEWIIAYIKNGFSSYIKRNHRENSSGWRADLEYAVRLSTYEKIINIKE